MQMRLVSSTHPRQRAVAVAEVEVDRAVGQPKADIARHTVRTPTTDPAERYLRAALEGGRQERRVLGLRRHVLGLRRHVLAL